MNRQDIETSTGEESAMETAAKSPIKYSKSEILDFKQNIVSKKLPASLSPSFFDGYAWNPEKFLRSCWNNDPSVHDRISNRRDIPRDVCDVTLSSSLESSVRQEKPYHRRRRRSNRSGSSGREFSHFSHLTPTSYPQQDEPEWVNENVENGDEMELRGFDNDNRSNSISPPDPRSDSKLSEGISMMPPPSQLTDLDMQKLLGIDISDPNNERSTDSSPDRNDYYSNDYAPIGDFPKSSVLPQSAPFDNRNQPLTGRRIYVNENRQLDESIARSSYDLARVQGAMMYESHENGNGLYSMNQAPMYKLRQYFPETNKAPVQAFNRGIVKRMEPSFDMSISSSVSGARGMNSFSQSTSHQDFFPTRPNAIPSTFPILQSQQAPGFFQSTHQMSPVIGIPNTSMSRSMNMPSSAHHMTTFQPIPGPGVPVGPANIAYMSQQPIYFMPSAPRHLSHVQEQTNQPQPPSQVYFNPKHIIRIHHQIEEQSRAILKARQQQEQKHLCYTKKPVISLSLLRQEGIDERLFNASTQIVYEFAMQAYKSRCNSRQMSKPNEEQRASYNLLTKQNCGRAFLKALTDKFGDFVLESLVESIPQRLFIDRKTMHFSKSESPDSAHSSLHQRRPSL